jgi:pimeloyl-ACP methyl ester carboxylesterase
LKLSNGFSFNYDDLNANCDQTLLFLHGNSHSHKIFTEQANSQALKDYRCIFLDLPGHGDSDPLKEYHGPLISELVSEFIQVTKLANYALIGHSFGGHIAAHCLKFILPKGLFIWGTPPFNKPFDPSSFLPNMNSMVLFQANSTSDEIDGLMNDFNYTGTVKNQAIQDYLKADAAFRATIFNSIPADNYFNEVQLLLDYKGKLHILLPTNETIISGQYIKNVLADKKSGIEFQEITSGHSPQIECPEKFNAILLDFCQVVFKPKP